MPTYRLFLVNFGWYSQDEAGNLPDAITLAKRKGYEARIDRDGHALASWSTFGGTRYYSDAARAECGLLPALPVR